MEENMKKLLVTSLALGVAGMATTAGAVINNTAHDISAGAYKGGPSSTEPCSYCHTPHGAYWSTGNGITNDMQAPLWDHETTVSNFTLYGDPFGTIDATDMPTGTAALPDGVAKACLSCHDGTVAVDSYHQSTGINLITAGTALLGTDLSNDHPVSFTYNAALVAADGELQPVAAVSNLLLNNKVECASCHDVHNAGFANFLVQTNAASALCLRCHIK
jgi:predicted CXXCH cytochrome family protein